MNSAAQKKDQEILQASTPSNAKTPEVQAVSSTSGDVTTVRVASMYFPCSASTARESSYGSGDRSLKMDRLHSGSMTGAGNEGKRVEKPGVVRPDSTATSQLYDDRHDLERPDGDFCTDNRLAWNPFYGLPGQYPRNVAPVMVKSWFYMQPWIWTLSVIDWLISWWISADWSIGRSVNRLIDWLIDWSHRFKLIFFKIWISVQH